MTGNAFDAEDVRQESILKALSRLDQFAGAQTDTRDDLHAWISRIAANASIDVIRRRREGKIFSLDQTASNMDEPFGAQIPSSEANPEQNFLRGETRRQLAAAITQLPAELRRVCLLLDVMQFSTQEVADRLGISCMAVRLRLFRAHRKLREKFNGKARPLRRRAKTQAEGAKAPSVRANLWTGATQGVMAGPTIGFACGAD